MQFLIVFLTLTSLLLGADINTVDDRSSNLKDITRDWNTNWNKHTIEYSELLSGGPPRDGIPPIDSPTFVSSNDAKSWIKDN